MVVVQLGLCQEVGLVIVFLEEGDGVNLKGVSDWVLSTSSKPEVERLDDDLVVLGWAYSKRCLPPCEAP